MASTSASAGLDASDDGDVLDVVCAVAREMGALIRAQSGRIAVEKTKATAMDLVTAADRQCQDLFAERVRAAFPGAAVLGEEDVAAGSLASAAALEAFFEPPSDLLFIVDPIDGTTNFVHGVPLSCVSIGVARRNELHVGCVYEPYRDELFTACRGHGAFLNGVRIAVAAETELSKALLAYGLGSSPRVADTMVRGLQAVHAHTRGQRSLGSAAVQLAYVAAGRFSAYWETDLSSWDLAAGALLIAEAGGRVTDTRGAAFSLRTRDILASNGAADIHDGLSRLLVQAKADSAPLPEPSR